MSDETTVERTFTVDYLVTVEAGKDYTHREAMFEDLIETVEDVFVRHGCEVQGHSDGPPPDAALELARAENERLREALRELADWVRQYHVERDAAALGSAAADLALLATMRQSMFDAADAAAASLSETGGEGA